MKRLSGKVAIVTGAGSGIGASCVETLAGQGASVVVADINLEAAEMVAERIKANGERAVAVKVDVTKEDSTCEMAAAALEAFGQIDILYNNAGGATSRDNSVVDAPLDEFWRAISLDLFGTWLCSRATIPHMIENGGGSIINVGSVVALIGFKKRSAYTASKGGVLALTRSMAVEYAEHKIRVNAVVPGVVTTDRVMALVNADPEVAKMVASYPLGPAEPIDVAQAVLYLASDESNRVTGHMLNIDSGSLAA